MTGLRTRPHRLRSASLAALSLAFASAVAAACADAGSPADTILDGGGPDTSPDTSPPDAASDAGADGDARGSNVADACSAAGWCATDLDPSLTVDDLWPLEGSAVAVASRGGRSSVLLYADASWSVIHQVPFLLVSIWASANDVWVSGQAGSVKHGHRGDDGWTWTDHPLAVSSVVSTVWGTGAHDVYALADGRVWRLPLESDGAPPAGSDWLVDYGSASGPEPDVTLVSLTGRTEGDLWVTGSRGSFPRCGLALHKTGGAWVNVVDSTPTPSATPFEPPRCATSGAVALMAPFGKGTAIAEGELVALTDVGPTQPTSFARVRHHEDGGAELTLAPRIADVKSLWGVSADDLYAASFSVVERGQDIWTDAGAWQVSTVAFEGIALAKPFYVVRGTRSDNLWLAGESHAFHKSTP